MLAAVAVMVLAVHAVTVAGTPLMVTVFPGRKPMPVMVTGPPRLRWWRERWIRRRETRLIGVVGAAVAALICDYDAKLLGLGEPVAR